jgi:thioredoxin 2
VNKRNEISEEFGAMSDLLVDDRGVLTVCARCSKRNRLAYAALDKKSKCGHCGTLLEYPAHPIEIPTLAAFDALVRDSVLPVVVDFWAPWCGPCRMVAPELEKVAQHVAGEYLVVKVNTDALPELGERLQIRSIPTMAVFRAGRELTRTAGARPAPAIEEFIRRIEGAPAR